MSQYRSILTQYRKVSTSNYNWPSTIMYWPVPPSIDPVPPSTNRYRLLLTQYHHISTSTTPYWPSTTKYQPVPTYTVVAWGLQTSAQFTLGLVFIFFWKWNGYWWIVIVFRITARWDVTPWSSPTINESTTHWSRNFNLVTKLSFSFSRTQWGTAFNFVTASLLSLSTTPWSEILSPNANDFSIRFR